MPRILVVEDERKVLRGLQHGLQAEDYDAETASDGEDGYRLVAGRPLLRDEPCA
jgi:DNA-binding response OmpR family regulator